MTEPAFHLTQPKTRKTSVIFASPHSGRRYAAAFLARSRLDALRIRSSEDAYIDQLFASAVANGAPLLAATAPRAFIDLNRAAEELDPALITGLRRRGHNPRIASGLGVIPRVVANGHPIYAGKIGMAEARRRIETHWQPYHNRLQRLIDENHAQFGEAILVDCHSMPHRALENVGPQGAPRPDVVIGDRFGAAASQEIVAQIEAAFKAVGLRVVRNIPFAGAYVTQQYGRPSRRQHAIQVEIDRSLYMDEAAVAPHAGFGRFQLLMEEVVAQIAAIGLPAAQQVAAE